MEALENRLESFSKTKRVKKGKKSAIIKWPHPTTFNPSPTALAEAGFYYDPSPEDPDNVTCFECEKQLSVWEEGDDPFDIHYEKCGDKCNWAVVRCGLKVDMDSDRDGRFTFPDKSRIPSAKKMEKARLGTYLTGEGWKHDQIKNHGASSRKMAQAGFAWTPQKPGDDLATCLYCMIALSGWEEGDDPMEEHRKRAKTCPFFTSTNITRAPSSTTLASQETTHRRAPSRSQSRALRASSQPLASRTPKARVPSSRGKKDEPTDSVIPVASRRATRKIPDEPSTDTAEEVEAPGSTEGDEDELPVPQPTPRRRSKVPASQTRASRNTRPKGIADRRQTRKAVEQSTDNDDDEAQAESQRTSDDRNDERFDVRPPSNQLKRSTPKAYKALPRKKGDSIATEVVVPPPNRRKTRKVVEEQSTDNVGDDGARVSTEHDDDEHFAPQPTPRGHSKVAASQTHPPKSTKSKGTLGRRKTRKVAERRSTDNTDHDEARQTSQRASESDEHPTPRPRSRESKTIKAKALAGANKHKTRQVIEQETTDNPDDDDPPLPVPKTPAEEDKVFILEATSHSQPPASIHGEESMDIDDDYIGQAPDEQRRTSVQRRTPPPTDLFSLNFDHTPKVDTPMAVDASAQFTAVAPVTPPSRNVVAPRTPPPTEVLTLNNKPKSDPPTPIDIPTQPTVEIPRSPSTIVPRQKSAEPQTFPALSRLPFMPLQKLADAELDMTVEEWIRYQMEMEFDKLKRDGERELARFKAHAEEVRKMIETL